MYQRLNHAYSNHRGLALCYHIITGNLWKPSRLSVLLSDVLGRRTEPRDNIIHCQAALQWLFRAQDATKLGGVSAEYNFSWGWSLPFPEVSGYIIPTMLNMVRQFPDEINKGEVETRALRIADWLVSIQNSDGSYNSGLYYDSQIHGRMPLPQRVSAIGKPCAFETGQIVWGLTSMYE